MNKLFTLIIFAVIFQAARAQTPTIPVAQAFGKVDKADLEMKACDFEKDANAEVLFDKGDIYFDAEYNIILERHRRIKIFNDNGKSEADIRLEYESANHEEYITGLQAETINLDSGAAVPVKVDKKQIFTQIVDKNTSAVVFTFPDVRPGCIIEYKYRLTITNIVDFPDWYFQGDLPTRYSELNTSIPDILTYKNLSNIHYPFVVNTFSGTNTHTRALANIPSLKDEPYMGARNDNSERILYQLLSIKQVGYFSRTFQDTWLKVGESVLQWDDFGGQLNRKLTGEDTIIDKAKDLKTDDAKIAYIFNEVKNSMKWDEIYSKETNDGTVKAWERKSGNSAEINLILYHLLKKSGLTVYPMLVSTRKHGRINPAYPNTYQFNSAVAYIPVDSTKYYVLDATSKYNIYNQIPANLLNQAGFYMNKSNNDYDLKFLQDFDPVREVVLINAEIKPEGKMNGTADISNFSYNRVNKISDYKTRGEKKYIDALRNNNNGLNITGLKFENMNIDTLPLEEKFDFNLDLTGSDDNYIYFNANLFTDLKDNPFLSETRTTDIDFGYRDNYAIVCVFKLPPGYKVDALPKSISMVIPDNTMVFKRFVAQENGSIMIRLNIDHKKSLYFKENYPEFREFCKKMYEMLNESIVLKKS